MEENMRVGDVMTRNVVSIRSNDTIVNAAHLMLQNRISGLPVVDAEGGLVGMVTEGDFLRRSEIATDRRRPKWIEFVLGPGRLADEYTHASGRKVEEVMTQDPVTVSEDDSVATVVDLMERKRVKRLPVLRGGKIVGIISRANLVRALVSLAQDSKTPAGGDAVIREQILAAFVAQPWAPRIDVTVKDGVVDLWGTITDDRERKACLVVAENVGGVRRVRDHIVWVEPMSGMAFPSPEDEDRERTSPQKDTASVNEIVARKTAKINNSRTELKN
jgi:CBS domain-containing protein